jgi:hypothetical protein
VILINAVVQWQSQLLLVTRASKKLRILYGIHDEMKKKHILSSDVVHSHLPSPRQDLRINKIKI